MADKPFREMTDSELHAEFEYWDKQIREATAWGAALAAADSFRSSCARELEQRGKASLLEISCITRRS